MNMVKNTVFTTKHEKKKLENIGKTFVYDFPHFTKTVTCNLLLLLLT